MVTVDDAALDREHLRRLVAAWGLVADLCFGDLLLLVPDGAGFRVLAQVRPTTSQTLYQDDLVGRVVSTTDRPLLADAWAGGQILEGQNFALTGDQAARVEYIPVHRRTDTGLRRIAVLTRELAFDAARRPGRLERVYLEVFDRVATMVNEGTFPFPPDTDDDGGAPRVGDGAMALDADRRVTYASPNAVSALHRMGVLANAEGRSLEELVPGAGVAEQCFVSQRPVQIEVEVPGEVPGARVTVQLRAIPLVEQGRTTAAVVLLHDVSDLRRRDRLLLSKDATIREVHHRVKNNLQTISALLRLQGRRLASEEAKEAIEESVRRIRSIALVHETLSRDVRDAVPFDDIVRPLVRMVEEGLASADRPLRFTVEGELGDLPPEIATPLAVVLTELLQNAVEHGYPSGTSAKQPGNIAVRLSSTPSDLAVEVRDDGVGLPEGFSPMASKSLGLSIVRTLVTSELGGAIAFRTDGGTVVDLRIPRVADPRARH